MAAIEIPPYQLIQNIKNMKQILISMVGLLLMTTAWGQENHEGKFEQLGTTLPTPNEYRNASGAPGYKYWQQQADYQIKLELNDDNQSVTGSERITYYNRSPEPLRYLWLQLDQNLRAEDSNTPKVEQSQVRDSLPALVFQKYVMYEDDFDGGFVIASVTDDAGAPLQHLINKTMMKIDLPEPLMPGEDFSFRVDWSYSINDRMMDGGRGAL